MKDELYQALNLEIHQIAKQVVNMQYEIHPAFKTYGMNGYAKSIQDAQYNLQFLLTAYQYNNLEILIHYLEWTDRLFKNINLPENTLLQHLELLTVVLQNWLKPLEVKESLKHQLINLLSEATEKLKAKQRLVSLVGTHEISLENPYYQRYEETIFKGDRGALKSLFAEMVEANLGLEFIYGEIMEVFQKRLGLLWHEQKITVAKEHFATAMSQYAMTLLYDQIFSTPRKGKRMLAACVSGELHEFGIRLIADYFEYKGWDTVYYGANNSQSALVQATLEQSPDIIFLSCTMTYHLDHLETLIGEIKKVGVTAPICVGGYPFDVSPVLSKQIGADYYTANFREAFLLAQQIVTEIEEDVRTDGSFLECHYL